MEPVEPVEPSERKASQSGLLRWAQDAKARSEQDLPRPPRPDEIVPIAVPQRPGASSEDPADAAAAARESDRRMGLIVAYMKDPAGDPAFQDKALMYTIFTEERTYQAGVARGHQAALRALPPPAEAMGLTPAQAAALPEYHGLEARRAELEKLFHTANTRQAQIFTLMKRLTGSESRSGGTGLLTPPPDAMPAPPLTANANDVLGELFGP